MPSRGGAANGGGSPSPKRAPAGGQGTAKGAAGTAKTGCDKKTAKNFSRPAHRQCLNGQAVAARSVIRIIQERKSALASNVFNAFVKATNNTDNTMRRLIILAGLALALNLAPPLVHAQGLTLTIKNHRFTPSELKVPAGKRLQLTVVNEDATPEEFESHAMRIEKVIPGNSKGVVRIGPLKRGRYPFVGEFHEATAKGALIAE
jgi:hypothetical protein